MFVLRNYTIENLFPEEVYFSGYDDISVIPKDERELVWFYQAPINFSEAQKAEIIQSYYDKLLYIISTLSDRQRLYVCSLFDIFPTNIVDGKNEVWMAINAFNTKARGIAESDSRIKFLDITEYFNQYSCCEWINWKFYFISQMIVSPKVASGFYSWFTHRIQQLNGYRKKCLVLDLDNTLWGGILGEDGIDGIKIGGDYPGNVYKCFQEAVLELADSGVILTVCSKNNEADVKELWEKNPFVKIKEQHLSSWRINWNNKADNIREIASELNIGLDSMVFIDDNPTERELIKQEIPMVAVPDFPSKPYQMISFIRKVGQEYFRTPTLTSEDLSKTEQYKANAKRISFSKNYSNLEEFIKSLEIQIDIFKADSFSIPRIAQMTGKTNQFNLTTKRYQESDIKSFIDNGDWVIGASVKDKFGDNGITAVSIVKINGNQAYIDTFLMSCRILGKNIEKAFLYSILNELHKSGIKTVFAEFIPTSKNVQVSDFYAVCGFQIEDVDLQGKVTYSLALGRTYKIQDAYKINIKI